MPSLKLCSVFALVAAAKVCSAAVLPNLQENGDPVVITELIEQPTHEVVEIVEHTIDPFDYDQQHHEVVEIVEIEDASPAIEIIDDQIEVVEYATEPRSLNGPSSAEAPYEEAPYEESISADSFDHDNESVAVEIEEVGLDEDVYSTGLTDWCLQTCQSFCAKYIYGPETDFSFGDSIGALEEQGCNFRGCAATCISAFPEQDQEVDVVEIQDQIEGELAEVVAEHHELEERLIIIEENGDV
ncbi:hypothetical protein QBC41DRAFT_320279 [Cercophora samala]|uniref:Uncharacterized protein n=1 Tax=Cercophora samala TaxID=330535 RepID=A0AA39ZEF1_9PEZI|nr:hypothetical protein QBC41DRAFT_320279 [Cercophora samala]